MSTNKYEAWEVIIDTPPANPSPDTTAEEGLAALQKAWDEGLALAKAKADTVEKVVISIVSTAEETVASATIDSASVTVRDAGGAERSVEVTTEVKPWYFDGASVDRPSRLNRVVAQDGVWAYNYGHAPGQGHVHWDERDLKEKAFKLLFEGPNALRFQARKALDAFLAG